jgi:putative ABC transport system permease protein
MHVSALDRKLLRDVWKMRGQAAAIALVVAAGVAMFVAYQSTFQSLRRTLDAYYDRQRFADVFASVKRAPKRLSQALAEIPGVAAVDTRVVAEVAIDVPGVSEPARGRLVGIPSAGRPRLNDLFLRKGRWIDPARGDEVLASEAFASANHFEPGAEIAAVINGRRRVLRIVGVALSPEYVYSLPVGEIIPDDRRFGILWMDQRALASAFDMEGGFNDAALKLMPGANAVDVVARVDRLLEPYGGVGAIPRALQFSHWTLSSELQQLQSFGVMIPLIFFGVAAFILNIALARALTLQRPQIASLKALGYTNLELVWHYLKWALLIASAGALVGTGAGTWLGAQFIQLYNVYFRFPSLDYRLSLGVTLAAVAMSLCVAGLGALVAVLRAVRIPPAEAMRPEPPVRYRVSVFERVVLGRRLSHVARMTLRNLERQPLRALASVIGIGFGTAILVMGYAFMDSMEILKEMQFFSVQRQDATVTFFEPVSWRAFHEVRHLPGVLSAEPMRAAPARLRFGHRQRTVSVIGLVEAPVLNRVVDRSGRIVRMPVDGLLLSKKLGEVLGVAPGDWIEVDVLEGARPQRRVRVADLVDEFLGLSAYMELGALHRLLREGETLSGAYLDVDGGALARLNARLKRTPKVAGVSLTANALRSFDETMAQNMDVMILINVVFAGIIAFGVVYNTARISLSERSHELASLRVLGFTRAEISVILLGELAVLTLAALPVGGAIGYWMTKGIIASMESEVYRFPFVLTPQALAKSWLIVSAAAMVSGLAVRRKLDHLDLIGVLKTRE